MIRLAVFLILTLHLIGCTKPFSKPQLVDSDIKVPIVGINQVLKDSPNIDVIFVHGMCTHTQTWVKDVNNSLLKALGSEQTLNSENLIPQEIFQGETEVYSYTFKIRDKTVRTHSIVWSPATTPSKKLLCYDNQKKIVFNEAKSNSSKDDMGICDSNSGKFSYKRAYINKLAKEKLLNDCLADAVIYSGVQIERIRNQFESAIIAIAGIDAQNKTLHEQIEAAKIEIAPLFVVTESLGSMIFFQTLEEMTKKGDDKYAVAKQTWARTHQIFMAANQMPILALAFTMPSTQSELHSLSDKSIDIDPIQNLANTLGNTPIKLKKSNNIENEFTAQLLVVAFSDPNDLLSYKLSEGQFSEKRKYALKDVIVSNSSTWFGLFENPTLAHTGYLDNPSVQHIIACGIPDRCSK